MDGEAAAPERLLAAGLLKMDEAMDGLKSDGEGPGGEASSSDEDDKGEVRGETGDMTVRPSTRVCRPVVLPLVLIVVVLLAISAKEGREAWGGAGPGVCVRGRGGRWAESLLQDLYLFFIFYLFFPWWGSLVVGRLSFTRCRQEDGWGMDTCTYTCTLRPVRNKLLTTSAVRSQGFVFQPQLRAAVAWRGGEGELYLHVFV